MAGLFRFFGVNEFSARAVSALAGVGVVAVIFGIGKLQRSPVGGLIAALILLTTFQYRISNGSMKRGRGLLISMVYIRYVILPDTPY